MRENRALLLLLCVLVGMGCGESTTSGAGGTGGAGGTPMVEPGPTCIAFCAHIIGDCDIDQFDFTEDACRQGCQTDLDGEYASSETCGLAVEAVFQCATDLDCDGVQDWASRAPPDAYPCRPQVEAVGSICPLTN